MQVAISARHGQISEDSQNLIREKVEKKLLHIFNRITMIEVTVDMKEEERKVEILVNAEHKHDFVANDKSKEVMTAVDSVLHKIEAQIRKYKDKIQDHRRDPSASDVAGAPMIEEPNEE